VVAAAAAEADAAAATVIAAAAAIAGDLKDPGFLTSDFTTNGGRACACP
jgi:hypothetical protein